MRLPHVVLCGALVALFACRSDETRARELPAEVEPEHASIALFDGETLAGWDGDPRFWSVEDGAIVGRSTSEKPCERTTYLIWRGGETHAEVMDFELELEFRIRGGNSGVQFRSQALVDWQVAGFQADL